MPRRPDPEIARAIARLSRETQLSLEEVQAELREHPVRLAGFDASPSAASLLRWGRTGRGGAYLDVLWCRRRLTWVTSHAALERFVQAVAGLARPAAAASD
jgi:hypothetical protein